MGNLSWPIPCNTKTILEISSVHLPNGRWEHKTLCRGSILSNKSTVSFMYGFILTRKNSRILWCSTISSGYRNMRIEEELSIKSCVMFKIYLKMAQMSFIFDISTDTWLVSINCLKFHGPRSGKEAMTPTYKSYSPTKIKL